MLLVWCYQRSQRTAQRHAFSKLTLSTGNTVFEPGKEGSHYRGGGSGSGDKEEEKKSEAANPSADKSEEKDT